LALILNGGNTTLVSPIDSFGEGSDGSSQTVAGNHLSVVFFEGTGGIDVLEFSGSQVSELVDGILNISGFSIELLDLVEVFNEDTESGEFFGGRVGLLVLGLPGTPHGSKSISLVGISGGNTSESQESNDNDEFGHCE